MKNPPVVISDSADEAEAQLQALIAECRQIIREVVVPAAEAAEEGGERRRYLDSAIALVRVANATGDAIARACAAGCRTKSASASWWSGSSAPRPGRCRGSDQWRGVNSYCHPRRARTQ